MTQNQYNISARNHRNTWKMLFGVYSIKGYVLHHKDPAMKTTNIERYILWLPEDLELMTKAEHVKLHRTGTHHTDHTKWLMRQAKLGKPKTEIQKQRMSESHKRYWMRQRVKKAKELLQAIA